MLLQFDFHVGRNLNDHIIISHLVDLAENTASGHHFITLGQSANQFTVFLGTLGLRTDQEEVKNLNQ